MNPHTLAFLVGLFGVPLLLLVLGHRIRRRSPVARTVFRGGVKGSCVGGAAALVVSVIPPEQWTSAEVIRGTLGLWGMVLFPIAGAILAWFFDERTAR